ncbi:MAG: DoxX family membrane protein [Chloroflexi bacterium]|nr:MAG: DoxX family membrane protein [Chloroflexota bacterium]
MSTLRIKNRVITDPPVAEFLFSNTRSSWLWLLLRVWLGYKWIDAALHKIDNPAWVQTGEALKGFWMGAVQVPEQGRPPIAFDWYRSFIQFLLDTESYTWFAKVIAYGEFLVGIALILGLFTGIAAFFGGFMNWNFIMAGAASTNGLMLVVAMLLILAWKVAGYIGLDYFLLPRLGTPWRVKSAAEVVEPPTNKLARA